MAKIENLPEKLKQDGLFCVWRYEKNSKGRQTKIPYNPFSPSYKAKSNDKCTFSDAGTAISIANKFNFDGIGVGIFNGITGIDIDHCIDEEGNLSDMAKDIVDIMDAYTEISPSGQGLRILFTTVDGFSYDTSSFYIKNSEKCLETYVSGMTNRFLTVTGNVIHDGDMSDRSANLQIVLDRYMKKEQANSGKTISSIPTTISLTMSDSELISKAINSRNGDKFDRLWRGDWSNYPSQSEADIAFCNLLAFWCQKEAKRMDRIFRMSGLMRDKWDKKHGADTYGHTTLQKAVASCTEIYDPKPQNTKDYFTSFKESWSQPSSVEEPPKSNSAMETNQQADEQEEYNSIIEIAKVNVLDRAVIEYAIGFNNLADLGYFFDEILPFAKNQRVLTDFRKRMGDIKKIVNLQQKRDERQSNRYDIDGTGKLTIENLAFYLEQNHIDVKYNVISHKMKIDGFESENREQLVENAPALIENDLNFFTGSTQERIASYLNVLAARNSYNPILDKIDSTVWDGKARLNDLFKLLGIDTNTDENKYNRIFLRKWLMQCICGLHNSMEHPFSLDIVLVFKGKQGIGKTRLLEALTLDSRYFGDGVVLDVRNKDDIMQSLSKWICELGEISSTFKKDIDSLKAFISKSVDEFRVPYGKTAVQYPRMTSFCGTVNEDEFLIDRTGNRRFAVIPLQEDLYIDYDDIKNFDFLQLWAEINKCIENMVKNGKSYSEIFRLNRSEIQELERRNGTFIKPVPAQKEIEDIIQMGDNYNGNYAIDWRYMTVAEFANHWSEYLKRYSVQQVGTALKALGIDTEVVKIDGNKRRLKKLPIRNFEKRITT